jgi:hypothetical protein
MQIVLAAILLIGLGSLLVWQFWKRSFDDGDVADAAESSATADTPAEELKAA